MYQDYEDHEIGALECEEIEGYVPESSDILLQYAEQFQKSLEREQIDRNLNKIEEQFLTEANGEEDLVDIVLPEKEKWDCESILSTYSNLYNHPKLISEHMVGELIYSVQ